jgi:CO dehydrogenase/acetyl-CoA synthase delta subunit
MIADSVIVEEVRRRREEISAQYDHDLHKYREHLREIQAANASRVVDQLTVVRSATMGGEKAS